MLDVTFGKPNIREERTQVLSLDELTQLTCNACNELLVDFPHVVSNRFSYFSANGKCYTGGFGAVKPYIAVPMESGDETEVMVKSELPNAKLKTLWLETALLPKFDS